MLLQRMLQPRSEHRNFLRLTAEFVENGYATLPEVLIQSDILALQDACDGLYAAAREPSDPYLSTDVLEKSAAFHSLIRHDRTFPLAQQLLGPNINLLSATLNYFGPGSPNQAWHIDYKRDWPLRRPQHPLWCLFPMVIVAYYLDDTTPDRGALWVVPGSHKRNDRPDQIDTHLPDEQAIAVRCGSAIIFDARLWHRAGENNTPIPRRALLFNYSLAWGLRNSRFTGPLIEEFLAEGDEQIGDLLQRS